MRKRDFEIGDVVLLKVELGRNDWSKTRVVKTEYDSNGAARSVQLRTVDSLNNQKLLRGPINKTVLLAENEMVQFPTEETNKGQGDIRSLEGSHR